MSMKNFFEKLEEELKTNCEKTDFETIIELPSDSGNGRIKGYDFGEGLSLIDISADIYKLIQLNFDDRDKHTVRYVFISDGELIHKLSPGFRYRLTRHTSSIAFVQNNDYAQKVIIPAQKSLSALILQINPEKYTENTGLEGMTLPDELAKVFAKEYKNPFFLYQSAYPIGIFDTLKMLYESKAEGISKRFFLESKALELIWMQTENYRKEELFGFEKDILRKKDIETLIHAKEYIRQRLHEELTLKKLARELGTNETKLKKGLKVLYGKTFGDILRNERLNHAKVLLEANEMNIKEIAFKCGYLNASVFAKRFKERFGVLPKNFMKR